MAKFIRFGIILPNFINLRVDNELNMYYYIIYNNLNYSESFLSSLLGGFILWVTKMLLGANK